ncbi:hypothetical protein EJD97_021881, partial [Solanum chilense]
MVKVMEDLVGVGVAGGLVRPALAYDRLENRLAGSNRVEFRTLGLWGFREPVKGRFTVWSRST